MAMQGPPVGKADEEELLDLLSIFDARLQRSHETIWEVEKHFTWWIYVIFGGIIAVLVAGGLDDPLMRAVVVFLGVGGISMSLLGLLILRSENAYFLELRGVTQRILRELNREPGFAPSNGQNAVDLRELLCPWYLEGEKPERNVSVRKCFRWVFRVAIAIFFAVIVLCAILL